MLNPGGIMFVATLNRTLKAFGLAILGAEYLLGWLPKGTHQWEKFITPAELHGWLAAGDCPAQDTVGVTYSPISGTWRKAADTDVNYMIVAQKPLS
jgi:2-polyprenyl-6-hydroxyphenyl methylase/3-demethylubiquinone-9 3-methyltransferase